MRPPALKILAAGLALATPLLVAAAPDSPSGSASATSQAEKLIKNELVPKVPGLSVAVFVAGKPIWTEAFGYSDLAKKTPARATTEFRIGSVSKTISSVALVELIQAGRIDLDAPIRRYIPDYAKENASITLRQLAGHLSGIRNYENGEILSDQPYPNLRAGLRIFEADSLLAKPGTAYSYSSYNWNALGAVIEAVTRQDFPSFVDARVLQPLGMKHTRIDRVRTKNENRASFYELGPHGTFVDAPEVDSSYKWPSGGYLSTAEDLAVFGSALLQPGILDQKSLELLFTKQKTTTGQLTHYGVGWQIGKNLVFHGGDMVGGTAALLIFPQTRTVIAFACNRGSFLYDGQSMFMANLRKAPDHWSSGVLLRAGIRIAKLFHASVESLPLTSPETASPGN